MRLHLLFLPALLLLGSAVPAQPGTLDLTFNPGDLGFRHGDGFQNTVFAVVEQPDGKVLVGGDFTTYSDLTVGRLIRLNADGTPDAGFNIGSGASGRVWSITLLQDGRILLAGSFQSINGVPRNRVAMLLPDGSLDASFDPGVGPSADVARVFACAVADKGLRKVELSVTNGAGTGDIATQLAACQQPVQAKV
jgi:hypothetical protein